MPDIVGHELVHLGREVTRSLWGWPISSTAKQARNKFWVADNHFKAWWWMIEVSSWSQGPISRKAVPDAFETRGCEYQFWERMEHLMFLEGVGGPQAAQG